MTRKSGQPHKGWKSAAKKYKVSERRLDRGQNPAPATILQEQNETSNEYVGDDGQFGVGA